MTAPATATAQPPGTGAVLRFGLNQLVRRAVHGVWVRGTLPEGPVVWAANHHSWWDGFVAASVVRADGRIPALLMDAANLKSFGFLRRSGVLGTSEPRAALAALRTDAVLIVFPEAELFAPGPLGPVHAGAQWMAAQGSAALVAVAVRVVMRGQQRPEVYVDFTDVGPDEALSEMLGRRLGELDNELRTADPREPLPGFDLVLPGRPGWDERIAGVAARLPSRRPQ